jgi:murein DD-endopeptidase MepM/ murein hydrolase activator NlpD
LPQASAPLAPPPPTTVASRSPVSPAPARVPEISSPPRAEPSRTVAALPEQPRTPVGIPEPPPRAGGKFLQPIKGKIIARYGPQGDGQHNDGINIAAARGQNVAAADNGVVVYAGNELRGFGNLLLIKHDGGWITAYAHNETLLVERGAQVQRGQPIARVGSTGAVDSPQLHFEIRKGTRAIDPSGLLE